MRRPAKAGCPRTAKSQFLDKLLKGRKPKQHGCCEYYLDPGLPGYCQVIAQGFGATGQHGGIQGVAAGFGVGPGNGFLYGPHPLGKGGVGLVGDAVVILDNVYSA